MLPAVTCKFDVSAEIRALNLATDALRTDAPGILRRAYYDIGVMWLEEQRQTFNRNKAGGGDWAPLAESTVRAKGNRVILVDSNALYLSLFPGGPNNVLRADPNGVEAGTADPKAHFHQEGRGRMHRAVIRPPTPGLDARMAQRAADGIEGMMRTTLGRAA